MTTVQKRAIKIVGILLAVYVGIVVVFESLLGYFQPESDNTVVITTHADGQAHERVLSLLEKDDQLYVAANHWPRAWYNRAIENPEVQLTRNGEKRDYRAVPVVSPEHEQLLEAFPVGPLFRFLMGYPPRYFIRLEPVMQQRESGAVEDVIDAAPRSVAPEAEMPAAPGTQADAEPNGAAG